MAHLHHLAGQDRMTHELRGLAAPQKGMGQMHASSEWKGGYRSILSDGRGHEVPVDLPKNEDGDDTGTSSLELTVLSMAGCISTIFALVAERRKLPFESLRVDLDAERPKGSPTIARVVGTVHVRSSAPAEDVEAAVAITVRTCPVGVLFHQARIPVDVRTIVEPPLSTRPPGNLPRAAVPGA